jgi:hypothetical protein
VVTLFQIDWFDPNFLDGIWRRVWVSCPPLDWTKDAAKDSAATLTKLVKKQHPETCGCTVIVKPCNVTNSV